MSETGHGSNETPDRVVYRNTTIRNEADLARAVGGHDRLARLRAEMSEAEVADLPAPSPESLATLHRRASMGLTATGKVPIVDMCVFKDRLFVATSEGVFERLDDGVFHEVRFVKDGDLP